MGVGTGSANPTEYGNDHEKLLGSTRQVFKSDIPWFDPLGSDASGNFSAPTGGPEQRKYIFDTLTAARPTFEQNSAQQTAALRQAATNPGYSSAAGLANRMINGEFLQGSPEFNAQMANVRQSANREADNQDAAIRSQYTRNGLAFGTANQQAQQSNRALVESGLNQSEAAARGANYANERNNQNSAVNLLDKATGAPINYLSQVPAATMAPMGMLAQIVTGLAGGGQPVVRPQDVVERDGYLRQATKSVGSL